MFSLEERSFGRSINDASQQPANTQVVEDVIVHKDVVQQDVVQEDVVEETVVDVIEKVIYFVEFEKGRYNGVH